MDYECGKHPESIFRQLDGLIINTMNPSRYTTLNSTELVFHQSKIIDLILYVILMT